MAKKYEPELRECVLCMLAEVLPEHTSLHAAKKPLPVTLKSM